MTNRKKEEIRHTIVCIYCLKEQLDISSFSLVIFVFFLRLWICKFEGFLMRIYVLNIKYIIRLLFIFTLPAIGNNIKACVQEIETKVYSAVCNDVFVIVFPFFRSFSRFFNFIVHNLFQNMVNCIFENVQVPVKHLCHPHTTK